MTAAARTVLAGGLSQLAAALGPALAVAAAVAVLVIAAALTLSRRAPESEVGDDVLNEFGGCSDAEIAAALSQWEREASGG